MSQKFQNIMKLVIPFTGHKEVLSLHEKTLEITKDDSLTSQGDCIVGVNSGISCIDLPDKMKEKIQNPESKNLPMKTPRSLPEGNNIFSKSLNFDTKSFNIS